MSLTSEIKHIMRKSQQAYTPEEIGIMLPNANVKSIKDIMGRMERQGYLIKFRNKFIISNRTEYAISIVELLKNIEKAFNTYGNIMVYSDHKLELEVIENSYILIEDK